VVENQSHRAGAHFRRKPVRRLAHDGSTFSRFGASGKPGAVHVGDQDSLEPDSCRILDLVTMSQRSSVPQATRSASQALMPDTDDVWQKAAHRILLPFGGLHNGGDGSAGR
jgi:hypothetical protein